MMQIVYFSEKGQLLTELETLAGEVTFVTPSPLKADGLRSRLSGKTGQDVLTIAKFTADLVSALWVPEERPQVKRKAELLLLFGILKNKYFPTLGYEQFTQAYNLFSDLRSFTLNEEALTAVMDEQPEEIRKAVALFWRLLEAMNVEDEHGAYQKITEGLRSAEEKDELRKTWVFWGFQHLNGQQVDLLKALAIRYNVVVPFPLSLKDKIKRTDWVSWLTDATVKEKELPRAELSPKGRWLVVNSRENAKHLREMLRPGDQVVLGVSKLSPSHLDIIPSRQVSYKVSHQLIDAELREIADELKASVKSKPLPEALRSLRRPGEFKRLKGIQLYEEALASISELTDEAPAVDNFFLKLLNDVVSLNQPRTSFFPMSPLEFSIDLRDMSTLEDVDRKRRVLLCIDERFEDIQGLGQNYTEAIQKALSSLGPLKRAELELLYKQWEFLDLFSHADVTVLMSEGTLKHSLVWKRLFAPIALEKIISEKNEQLRDLKDHFKGLASRSFEGRFSASKFQAYLDCPRKFYFSYVDKVFPNLALMKDFDPMTSGTIIHRIIELYYKRGLSPEKVSELTTEVMEEHIQERKLQLPRETYLQRRLIFNHRAMNGIRFLDQLTGAVGDKITWTIEEEFDFTEGYHLTGKIDCLGVGEKTLFLLDFKSTAFAASTNKEVEEMESMQLWAYAKAASLKHPDFSNRSVVLGYVVLDNPSESNLLLSDEGLQLKLKDAKLCKQKLFKDPFPELFKTAEEKMVALAQAIRTDKNFPATPRKAGACHFCELSKVCVKGGVA